MTTLLRWDPRRDMASLQTELARVLSGVGERDGRQTEAWAPPLNVWESEDTVTYSFDLPGVPQGEISIEAEDGRLTISATRTRAADLDHERFYRLESRYGTFSRTVGLPQGVSEDAIAADYKDGVLTITVPKPEQPKAKRIMISGENASQPVDIEAATKN